MRSRLIKHCLVVALFVGGVALGGLAGCTQHAKGSHSASRSESARDPKRESSQNDLKDRYNAIENELARTNDALEQLTARYENLAEANRQTEEELHRTREILEYAERQFISLEQGLQKNETKASAVAALAEAQLSYEKALEEVPRARESTSVDEAMSKIRKADEMLARDRFAASVYFATRALRLLENRHSRSSIRVVSAKLANLRIGPGLDYEVIEQLPIGTVLVQHDVSNSWIKVETRAGRRGWIHQSVTANR